MFILASASPRRIEMLQNAGYDPVVKPASIIEKLPFEMPPETATMFLALTKASAIHDEIISKQGNRHSDWPPQDDEITIVAADTVVVYDGEIIGKPADENEAYAILSRLRGRSHHVITGCCIIGLAADEAPATRCFYEDSEVFFKNFPLDELRAYVKTDEPYDKAGGYAVQETFGQYIDHVDGDLDNVIGLPLTRLKQYID
ncbi:MAG: Maf family protein [Bacillota bacterium]|nr:Maf family protein [Bacillota bacterium]